VDLKPWADRKAKEASAAALVNAGNAAFSQIPGAVIFALNPPPIQALGNASGFSMKLEDRGGENAAALEHRRDAIVAEARKSTTLAAVRTEGLQPAPQLHVDIDRIKARALGLTIGDVNATLAIAFGSAYANDFTYQGNVLRVYLQADAAQRMSLDDLMRLRVRSLKGMMVPFSAFTTANWTAGEQQLERYNGYPSQTIAGEAAPGYTSGDAIAEMERIATKLQAGNSFEWTGIAYQQKQAGGQIGALLGLSVIFVFLLLAALYESWAIPLAVLLIVPFGVFGAALLTLLRGMAADIYFNVGLITIIGLAAKNAILIVEFAKDSEGGGRDLRSAAVFAARERLRPILMTSLAFILAMVPLVVASGAGAGSKEAVGTGVMGGMITAMVFGLFFTPLFYYAARRWLSRDNDYEARDLKELSRRASPSEAGHE
jgi:multidrug efflux pump